MSYSITWIGQGGFLIQSKEKKIVIDPYLSDLVEKSSEGLKRLVCPIVRPEEFHADLVIITHDHMDHLDSDTIRLMEKKNVRFAGPESCRRHLKELDVEEEMLISFGIGDRMSFAELLFEAVYAEHTEDSIGVLITDSDGRKVYITGDSLLSERVGNGIKTDILITCINGRLGNMNVDEAVLLTKRVGAKVGIPMHYGMFAENTADPQEYLDKLGNGTVKGVILEYGREYMIEKID